MKHPIAKAGLQMMLRQFRDRIDTPDYVILVEAIRELEQFETYQAYAETAYEFDNASLLEKVIDPQVIADLEEDKKAAEEIATVDEKADLSFVNLSWTPPAKAGRPDEIATSQWSAIQLINAEIDDAAERIYDDLTTEQELGTVHQALDKMGFLIERTKHHASFEVKGDPSTLIQLSPGEVRSLIIGLLVVLNDLNTNEGDEL